MIPLINWYHHSEEHAADIFKAKGSVKDVGVSCNRWYRFYGTSYRTPVEQRSQIVCNGTPATQLLSQVSLSFCCCADSYTYSDFIIVMTLLPYDAEHSLKLCASCKFHAVYFFVK